MADDSEFITKLISFGLSEKEAQLYFHLLKYGPKPPSLLAKSLKTYREDIYRTLNGLIDKGMVNPSLDSPTVYAAVELDIALNAALKTHETELREMEKRKQELQELSKRQTFRPSDEFSTFKIIKNIKEALSYAVQLFNSAVIDITFILPPYSLVVTSQYGDHGNIKKAFERGVRVRGITDISHKYVDIGREYVDLYVPFGYELRHFNQYRGISFIVVDGKESISSINIEVRSLSLKENIAMLWCDDPTYAAYLMSTFELLWEQAIPAAQRIEELLKEGPPQT